MNLGGSKRELDARGVSKRPVANFFIDKYIRICYNNRFYNDRFYNDRFYNEQYLSIKQGCYNEHNERGGVLLADVACACAWRVGPSRFA